MSREDKPHLDTRLEAGAGRLVLAGAETLPADFRHFHVALSVGAFTATRVFGVEICHTVRQGAAPATRQARMSRRRSTKSLSTARPTR